MVERNDAERGADEAERVDITFVGLAPSLERNAELVGAPGRGEELGFVEPECCIELADARNGRFADSDRRADAGADPGTGWTDLLGQRHPLRDGADRVDARG